MEIELWPQDKLLTLVAQTELGKRSEFWLRALRLRNEREQPCRIESVQCQLYAGDQCLHERGYRATGLEQVLKRPVLNRKGLTGVNGQILLGRQHFWDLQQLQAGAELLPGQEAGLLLERMELLHPRVPDRLRVLVEYTEQGQGFSATYAAEVEIPLQVWGSPNRYLFPLQGAWMLVNTPFDVSAHRLAHAQEFALDLIQVDARQRFASAQTLENRDYPGYGAEVLAAAAGRVVAVCDGIPENPGPLGKGLAAEQKLELQKQFSAVAVTYGNHLIVEHAHGEYSLYAHLQPGSLRVRSGEPVEPGQSLAQVGNSGNSDAPHLHFQLMDGADLLTARGLPCAFINLRDVMGQPVQQELWNHLLVHALPLKKH